MQFAINLLEYPWDILIKTPAHLLPEMTANLIIPAAMIIWLSIINIKLTEIIMLWIINGIYKGLEIFNEFN